MVWASSPFAAGGSWVLACSVQGQAGIDRFRIWHVIYCNVYFTYIVCILPEEDRSWKILGNLQITIGCCFQAPVWRFASLPTFNNCMQHFWGLKNVIPKLLLWYVSRVSAQSGYGYGQQERGAVIFTKMNSNMSNIAPTATCEKSLLYINCFATFALKTVCKCLKWTINTPTPSANIPREWAPN